MDYRYFCIRWKMYFLFFSLLWHGLQNPLTVAGLKHLTDRLATFLQMIFKSWQEWLPLRGGWNGVIFRFFDVIFEAFCLDFPSHLAFQNTKIHQKPMPRCVPKLTQLLIDFVRILLPTSTPRTQFGTSRLAPNAIFHIFQEFNFWCDFSANKPPNFGKSGPPWAPQTNFGKSFGRTLGNPLGVSVHQLPIRFCVKEQVDIVHTTMEMTARARHTYWKQRDESELEIRRKSWASHPVA